MKNTLNAAVLLIGNELLSGSIQDQNLSHIALKLEEKGIRVRETRIIPDIEEEIVYAVNHLREKYDYVFTTGGIGPTHDDITSDSIAKAFGVKNVIQDDVFKLIQGYLEKKGAEFTPAVQRMAYAPEGAEIMPATDSIIPGYRIGNVFVMAGVPRVMQIMLTSIIEILETGQPVISESVHADVSEGQFAASLEKIQSRYPDIDIGSYPQDIDSKISNYRVIFVIRGTDVDQVNDVREQILQACKKMNIEAVYIPKQ